jgi:hypothetical protein
VCSPALTAIIHQRRARHEAIETTPTQLHFRASLACGEACVFIPRNIALISDINNRFFHLMKSLITKLINLLSISTNNTNTT